MAFHGKYVLKISDSQIQRTGSDHCGSDSDDDIINDNVEYLQPQYLPWGNVERLRRGIAQLLNLQHLSLETWIVPHTREELLMQAKSIAAATGVNQVIMTWTGERAKHTVSSYPRSHLPSILARDNAAGSSGPQAAGNNSSIEASLGDIATAIVNMKEAVEMVAIDQASSLCDIQVRLNENLVEITQGMDEATQ
ncbi:hypothetical protein PM082_018168 [Marasmius tenuissimus]|nr:hypothetical protein PM082_018168 [Marasmius tenuissimus]